MKAKLFLAPHPKTLLMFNQSDTLAEQVDCNVWEGECAAGADSSNAEVVKFLDDSSWHLKSEQVLSKTVVLPEAGCQVTES